MPEPESITSLIESLTEWISGSVPLSLRDVRSLISKLQKRWNEISVTRYSVPDDTAIDIDFNKELSCLSDLYVKKHAEFRKGDLVGIVQRLSKLYQFGKVIKCTPVIRYSRHDAQFKFERIEYTVERISRVGSLLGKDTQTVYTPDLLMAVDFDVINSAPIVSKTYSGFLAFGNNGEEDDILSLVEFQGDQPNPDRDFLSELISVDVNKLGRLLTVRYWISDRAMTKDDLQERFVNKLTGIGDVEYDMQYSEYTGYLYTNEALIVGGHDLLEELKSHVGKYLHLEIDFE